MKKFVLHTSIAATALTLLLSPAGSTASPKHSKHFGKNAPFRVDDLPESRLKAKLKRLQYQKRQRAMSWLHTFSFSDHDLKHLEVDDEGGVLYGDSFDMTELTEIATESVEQPQAVSAADTFKLHSKPGSTNVIYIDFNGHSFSNTAWSSSTIQARPFDTDGNAAEFGASELAQIAEIWHRVAEDFAPFDVDVTTEEPASFGPTTGRILITHNKDVSGADMPYSTAGGVAYVNVWGRSNYASYYSPALVYYNNLASFAPYIAEAASHEMGHNLSLSHDGTSTQSYYKGHGSGFVSWGPIMGVGYYTNVTQWSKGEYADASQTQDDISLITSRLNLRSDDHGDDIFTPSALYIDSQGNIPVTSPETDPHNLAPENKGIIETRDDVDFFAFDAGAGPVDITVTPAWDSFYRTSRRGANLDIQAVLYDWDGNVIASSEPIDETDAQISTTVSGGQYLLAVSGVGNSVTPYSDYGSLGQYYISGQVAPFTPFSDNTPPSPNPMGWAVAPFSQSRTSISMQATTASDESGSVEYNFVCVSGTGCSDSGWQSSNQYTATGLQPNAAYSYQVLARDSFGNETNPSASAGATTAANNVPQSSNGNASTPEDNSVNISLSTLVSDADGDALSFSIQSSPAHGTVVNLNNGSVTYTPAIDFNGNDSFVYKVTDAFGGSSNATVIVTVSPVNDAPIANASAPANNSTLTVNFSSVGSFDPDANDTLSYHWNFGDGSSSTASDPSHSYASAGTYNVTLTISDKGGLSDSVTLNTSVNDPNNVLPDDPANLTYSASKIYSGKGRYKTVVGTVSLKWDSANATDSYEIWRCDEVTTGNRKNRITTCTYPDKPFATSLDTSFDTGLTSNTVRYKVRARNNNGISAFSNEISVKP